MAAQGDSSDAAGGAANGAGDGAADGVDSGGGGGPQAKRFFQWLLARPRLGLLGVLVLTCASLVSAGLWVRPDFSVEYLFPSLDRSKVDYDRYKADFPYEDARALVLVEADDLYSREGLARMTALEHDLAHLPGVIDVEGLVSVQDVVGYDVGDGDTGIKTERLFPRADLSDEEIAARRKTATTDPLFAWTLTPPDARAITIRVTLDKAYAAKDATRMQFLQDVRGVVAKHASDKQRIVLNGLPIIRAEYTELISRDMGTLIPLVLLVTLLLLFVSFRQAPPVIAGMLTILASVIWTLGFGGLLGFPIQLLTQLTPIVCVIISVSDTVHIVAHYQEARGHGVPHRDAIVVAAADSAWPCFLTEVVIALGFLGLVGQDVVLISQFGLLTGGGMLLTWLANMTVLPLALFYMEPRRTVAREGTAVTGTLERAIGWIDSIGQRKPRRVAIVATCLVALSALASLRVGREYYSYDDLYPDHPLYKAMRYTEEVHGGTVPLAILLEPPARRILVVAEDNPVARDAEAALRRSPLAKGENRSGAPYLTVERARGGEEALARLADAAEPLPHAIVVELASALADDLRLPRALADHDRAFGVPVHIVHRGASPDAATRRALEASFIYEVHDLATASVAAAGLARALRAGEPMLEPEAIALMDRVASYLESTFPEMRQAASAADYWKKAHRLWVGDEIADADPLPQTRGAALQEIEWIDAKLLRDFLSHDRATAAVFGMLPDIGSSRSTDLIAALRGYLDEEEAKTGYRLTMTGIFAIADGIYRNMVGGLAISLGFALLISLGVFSMVLRSWRLGLIALVPNVLPLLFTLAIMATMGIDLKPTTVICFSITLVIADDDTIQFLVRYRRRFLQFEREGRTSDIHGAVASQTMGDTGLPMFLTACTVSLGFLALTASQFVGLRNLGLLIGVSLFTAVFADLFLSPLLLRFFRPSIGQGAFAPGAPDPAAPTTSADPEVRP